MKTRSKGTTLMELMAALTVLAILVAIAVPQFPECDRQQPDCCFHQ